MDLLSFQDVFQNFVLPTVEPQNSFNSFWPLKYLLVLVPRKSCVSFSMGLHHSSLRSKKACNLMYFKSAVHNVIKQAKLFLTVDIVFPHHHKMERTVCPESGTISKNMMSM